jgi:thiol-disulfide isomerase/thioredoxin/outer membrane lipoprotein-sorting protein
MRFFAQNNSLKPLILAVLLAAPAFCTEPDAKEILRKAEQAAAAFQLVSYKAQAWGEGVLDGRIPHIEGTVKAKRGPTDDSAFLRVDGIATGPQSKDAQPFRVVVNGKQILLIDERAKTGTVGDWPEAAVIAAEPIQALYMHELTKSAPFKTELSDPSLKYEGRKPVAGTECHVIHAGGETEARWYFAVSDSLPRRVDRIFRVGDRIAVRVLELSDIDTAPKFDDTTFAISTPEGYKRETYKKPKPRRAPGLLAVGSEAPDWTLKTPSGKSVTLSKLRGKVVVLDFWATWCGPCILSMPGVQKLHEKFKGKPVEVFGVDTWESEKADPVAFMKKKGVTYRVLLKGDAVAQAYGIKGIPTFYVIGPDGKVLHASSGYNPKNEEKLTKLIEDALKKGD